jgi:hypothetical protein
MDKSLVSTEHSSHLPSKPLNSDSAANNNVVDGIVHRSVTAPLASSPPPHGATNSFNSLSHDAHVDGLDLPWVTRDLNHSASSAALTTPSSPTRGLSHRVSELNLSAHPSRHAQARKNQSRTACFVHSLLQNNRARSPSRSGSTDDLRGSMVEVMKGPERRDRWNRGMTKKELSDMALGVRELSKRLGMTSVSWY